MSVGSIAAVGVSDAAPTRTALVSWGEAVAARADAVISGKMGEVVCGGAPP